MEEENGNGKEINAFRTALKLTGLMMLVIVILVILSSIQTGPAQNVVALRDWPEGRIRKGDRFVYVPHLLALSDPPESVTNPNYTPPPPTWTATITSLPSRTPIPTNTPTSTRTPTNTPVPSLPAFQATARSRVFATGTAVVAELLVQQQKQTVEAIAVLLTPGPSPMPSPTPGALQNMVEDSANATPATFSLIIVAVLFLGGISVLVIVGKAYWESLVKIFKALKIVLVPGIVVLLIYLFLRTLHIEFPVVNWGTYRDIHLNELLYVGAFLAGIGVMLFNMFAGLGGGGQGGRE